MAPIQPPPFTQLPIGKDGRFTRPWEEFILKQQQGIQLDSAPADARFVTVTANAGLSNESNLGALSAGYLRITTALGVATVFSAFPATAQFTPGNPTGTASLVGVMMGLAGGITPATTGRVQITVSGTIFNATAIADGAKVQIRTAAGAAPANGAALSGIAAGGLVQYVAATVAQRAPFCLSAIVSGLTLGVAIWLDVSLAAIAGGTATLTDISLTAMEV